MTNVYKLRAHRYPIDTKKCVEKILAGLNDAKKPITGLAFVAYVDDTGFIADACGKARAEIHETRLMLRELDAKLAKWERK